MKSFLDPKRIARIKERLANIPREEFKEWIKTKTEKEKDKILGENGCLIVTFGDRGAILRGDPPWRVATFQMESAEALKALTPQKVKLIVGDEFNILPENVILGGRWGERENQNLN